MPDRLFYKNSGPHKLFEIAKFIGCTLPESTSQIVIHDIKSLEKADTGDLAFLNNMKYTESFMKTKASVCLVPMDFAEKNHNNTILLKVKNPYYSYAKLIDLFYMPQKDYSNKIMPSAYIAKSAKIGKNCYIGHNVVIEDDAEIGNNCIIESGTVIDYKVKIGDRARISAGVTVSYSIIGDDAVILSGAKIGQDGFGFATEDGIHKKIYHTGRVIIGNNVEIGANSTIDRGSIHDTIIEDLCRIDNLVQIGHNAIIKKGTILVAQVGIAGSSKIGSYCALGGQVGVAGHVTITDNVQVAAQGGVIQDITDANIMGGTPAVPIRDWHRQTIIMRNLIKNKK